MFDRLCDKNVAVNPRKTEQGLEQVEYVGHFVSTTSTSFTPEKRLKVLDFPEPTIQKAILQSIGLANYFRDHVSDMITAPEDRQARPNNGEFYHFQAMTTTSYMELSGTLLLPGR